MPRRIGQGDSSYSKAKDDREYVYSDGHCADGAAGRGGGGRQDRAVRERARDQGDGERRCQPDEVRSHQLDGRRHRREANAPVGEREIRASAKPPRQRRGE